jgi:hypothetical protein
LFVCLLACFIAVNYSEDLAKVMKKIILLSKIAHLAKGIEKEYCLEEENQQKTHRSRAKEAGMTHDRVTSLVQNSYDDEESVASYENVSSDQTTYVIDPDEKDNFTGAITETQRIKINRLLGDWEEPEKTMGIEVSEGLGFRFAFAAHLKLILNPIPSFHSSTSGGSVCACNSQVSSVLNISGYPFHVLLCVWAC